jgi:diguanylate cyclase (GGDEF)-like protein/PAS domain S-box-containing protein
VQEGAVVASRGPEAGTGAPVVAYGPERRLPDDPAELKALFEASVDIITVLEPDGTWRFSTEAGTRVLNWPAGVMPENGIFGLVHPDDASFAVDAFGAVIEGRRGPDDPVVLRIAAADGGWHWFEIAAHNLVDDPRVRGIVLNARHVCERHRLEEQLQQRILFEDAIGGIISCFAHSSHDEYEVVAEAFGLIGPHTGADRVFAYRADHDARTWQLIHEWCADDVSALRPAQPVIGFDEFGALTERMLAGRRVRIDDLRAAGGPLPADELRDDSLVSFLCVPVRNRDGRVDVAIGLDARHRRSWDEDAIRILEVAGGGVVAAFERRDAREAIHRREQRFAVLAQNLSDVVTVVGPHDDLRLDGPGFLRVLGWPRDVTEPLLHPDDADDVARAFRAARDRVAATTTCTFRMRHADDSWRWFEGVITNLVDDPSVAGVVMTSRDVTDRKRAETLVADQARLLERLAEGAPISETLEEVCRCVQRHVGDALAAVLLDDADDGPWLAAGPDLTDDLRLHVLQAPAAPPAWLCWAFPVRGDHEARDLGSFLLYLRADRELTGADRQVVDLMLHVLALALERRAAEDQLLHLAYHDPLTGLPNRALFSEMCGHALAGTGRTGTAVAVLFLDVDRFKVVNDSLGHDHGDELLRIVAERLRVAVRPGDLVARLGGDEFAVLCQDLEPQEAQTRAAAIAERLLTTLREPCVVKNDELFVSGSIGIAVSGRRRDQPEQLLADADAAMYRAKRRGKDRWELFNASLEHEARQRLDVERALHGAIGRGEMFLDYQPIVELATGNVVGAEALLRWRSPIIGVVEPSRFIGIAEDTGLIVPIGRWILAEACRWGAQWHAQAGGRFHLAVNLSARQLDDPDLAFVVQGALEESGLPAEGLMLEATESALMGHFDVHVASLGLLDALGVRIAIDDFGTGYSSLAYVGRFPIAELKIDRSFVIELGSAESDSSPIVAAVVALGRTLGVRVVAEGVETDAQRDALVALGCDLAQGYLLGKPAPPEEVGRRLAAQADAVRER